MALTVVPSPADVVPLPGKSSFQSVSSIAHRWGGKRLCEPNAAVEYDPMDLINFIKKNFVQLNMMLERAGTSEVDIYNRTRDVFLHTSCRAIRNRRSE